MMQAARQETPHDVTCKDYMEDWDWDFICETEYESLTVDLTSITCTDPPPEVHRAIYTL